MKSQFAILTLGAAIVLGTYGFCQEPTVAGLNHETAPDVSRAFTTSPSAASPRPSHVALRDSWLSREAARALFANSDLARATTLARQALRRDRFDAEALFVQMEAADMEEDRATMLDSAIRLCELGGPASADPRARLAAVRIREAGANTGEFRKVIPGLQALLTNSPQGWPAIDHALLKAAMDGAPGLNPYTISRSAGILTDWRIVAVAHHDALLDLDPTGPNDGLAQSSYKNQPIENFQFPDGRILMPAYLSHRGMFYAASRFASWQQGDWTLRAEGGATLEVYVDGHRVLRTASATATLEQSSATFEVSPGPHLVLVKFRPSATPLRISMVPEEAPAFAPLPAKMSAPEATYLLAAERYIAEDFVTAVKQIDTLPNAWNSAPLQCLRAQSLQRVGLDATATWRRVALLTPAALAADEQLAKLSLAGGNVAEAVRLAQTVLASAPTDSDALETLTTALQSEDHPANPSLLKTLWLRRIAAHPSCAGLQAAITFYRGQGGTAEASIAQQKLDGCAPESLDYAESLSHEGQHQKSAEALEKLISAAPLNREARLMLVGELQLAGEDTAAQRAAAEWLHVAPNAEQYHRLAASDVVASTQPADTSPKFYLPYRRDGVAVVRENAGGDLPGKAVELIDDHVALLRPDGSVSLYVHTVTLPARADGNAMAEVPAGAQALVSRVIHADGSTQALLQNSPMALASGDAVDEEYVIHYAGDGGIPEHSEAFQFVFGSFGVPVVSARFVALTSTEHADRGVVITTGDAPAMSVRTKDGMMARIWQKDVSFGPNAKNSALAIVRVVEQENGWSIPSNAEHQKRIETIHPGPRPEDASLPMKGSRSRNLLARL